MHINQSLQVLQSYSRTEKKKENPIYTYTFSILAKMRKPLTRNELDKEFTIYLDRSSLKEFLMMKSVEHYLPTVSLIFAVTWRRNFRVKLQETHKKLSLPKCRHYLRFNSIHSKKYGSDRSLLSICLSYSVNDRLIRASCH